MRELMIQVAKAMRRRCSCYMNLCGDCQAAAELIEIADALEEPPEESSWDRYKEIRRRWQERP